MTSYSRLWSLLCRLCKPHKVCVNHFLKYLKLRQHHTIVLTEYVGFLLSVRCVYRVPWLHQWLLFDMHGFLSHLGKYVIESERFHLHLPNQTNMQSNPSNH